MRVRSIVARPDGSTRSRSRRAHQHACPTRRSGDFRPSNGRIRASPWAAKSRRSLVAIDGTTTDIVGSTGDARPAVGL